MLCTARIAFITSLPPCSDAWVATHSWSSPLARWAAMRDQPCCFPHPHYPFSFPQSCSPRCQQMDHASFGGGGQELRGIGTACPFVSVLRSGSRPFRRPLGPSQSTCSAAELQHEGGEAEGSILPVLERSEATQLLPDGSPGRSHPALGLCRADPSRLARRMLLHCCSAGSHLGPSGDVWVRPLGRHQHREYLRGRKGNVRAAA